MSDVVTRNVAISQSWYPTLEPFITVPVLVLKNYVGQAFSLQRNFMVAYLGRCWTLVDPHSGQHTPSGQRCLPTATSRWCRYRGIASAIVRGLCPLYRFFRVPLPYHYFTR